MLSRRGETMADIDGSNGQRREYRVVGRATGVKLNWNMFEYKKPAILDLGQIEAQLV
jgi:hypothetical protein